MKKKISFLLVAALLLATLIPALPIFAADETTGGETVANTFDADAGKLEISTKEDYINFYKKMLENGGDYWAGKTITLMQDITFNDTTKENWWAQEKVTKLEGTGKTWNTFKATFNGNGHTLKGVIVEGYGHCYSTGLFPSAVYGAVIKNLTVDGFYVCGTNTTSEPANGNAGIGGLIGAAADDVTVDNCILKNGIVTGADGAKGSLGGIIGSYYTDKSLSMNIINSTVFNVQVLKGGCAYNEMGGVFGYVEATTAADGATLNLSGSVLQPTTAGDVTLGPVGSGRFQGTSDAASVTWQIQNLANGYSDSIQFLGSSPKKNFYGAGNRADCTELCNSKIMDAGCYGSAAAATVQLVGVQNSTTGNGLRFVGLIKKSAIEAGTVATLGFEISAGGKSAEAECTKVYSSILENGQPLDAPEGYYFFTFVVTDIANGTEFAVNAVAAVGETECTTTEWTYTYPHTAS